MIKVKDLDDVIFGFNYKISGINKFLGLIDDSIETPNICLDEDEGISVRWRGVSIILTISFYYNLDSNCYFEHMEIDHETHTHRFAGYKHVKDVDCLPMDEILNLLNKHFKKE